MTPLKVLVPEETFALFVPVATVIALLALTETKSKVVPLLIAKVLVPRPTLFEIEIVPTLRFVPPLYPLPPVSTRVAPPVFFKARVLVIALLRVAVPDSILIAVVVPERVTALLAEMPLPRSNTPVLDMASVLPPRPVLLVKETVPADTNTPFAKVFVPAKTSVPEPVWLICNPPAALP